ncbi:MAG TPA: nitroreductase family deazaflavin-dependent oxidoreductase [Thermomicrobiales bacterium]|nr:nitroreductase family deazaflavin-dependent oxidoreductase [Thermomicrobiales bacterium]
MADPNDFNTQLIEEYRATEGNVTGVFAGRPLMLLTTTGAKSGQPRTAPLVYTTDGDALVVIASKGGAPTNPDWYHNLRANSLVTVELGAEQFEAQARVAEGDERQRLYDAQAALMPAFADYQTNTDREIPVVVLERLS